MNKRRNNFLFFGIIFLGASIFLFAIVISRAIEAKRFIESSVVTEGIIEDYTENETTDSRGRAVTDYYPVIKYTDRNGTTHSFKSGISMNYEVSVFIEAKNSGFTSTQFKAPKVRLMYRADNPSLAMPARSFFDIWGDMIVLTIISAAVCFTGCGLIYFHHENRA